MATSTIKYPMGYSHREAITFPFTPQHNGIASILILRGDSSTSWTYRNVEVTEDGAIMYNFNVAFYTAYSGHTVSFPVIAGKTYSLSGAHASNVYQEGIRTNYVY